MSAELDARFHPFKVVAKVRESSTITSFHLAPLDRQHWQPFEAGQFLDVAGISRGRGFSGVVRRHKFAGSVQTHGTHEYRRHGGSIGTNMTPGRTKLGMRMPGQHGNKRVSVLSQRVAKVIADQHLVLVHGGVPGAKGGVVELRGAIKRRGGRPAK